MKRHFSILLLFLFVLCALPAAVLGAPALFTPSIADTPIPSPVPAQPSPTPYASISSLEDDQQNEEGERIVLSFAGDCTLASREDWQTNERHFVQTIAREGYAYPFSGIGDIFHSDDLTLVNLEGVFTDTGRHKANKTLTFRAPTDYVNILPLASIEAVNLANNHTIDYQEWGQQDTRDALASVGIAYCEGTAPTSVTVNGIKIGLIGKYMPRMEGIDRIYAQIDQLREDGCDLIIASFHWGIEYEEKQNRTQREVGRAVLDYGADAIIGTHPHILQGIELYNGKPIFYSLGNFCFGGNINPPDWQTFIAQLEYERTPEGIRLCTMRVIPCLLSGSSDKNRQDFRPVLASAEDSAEILTRLEKLSVDVPASFFEDGEIDF